MSNIEIVNNVPTLNGTPVQTIIDAYSSKHGLRFTMVVVKNRSNNGFSLTLPEDFYKGNSDNKAYHGTKAHLGAAEALIEAGVDQSLIETGFRNMRKDSRSGSFVPAARIFLNPPPSQSSVAYSAEADLAKAAEAFYSAGGTAEPPAAVASNPAALAGWYKGQTKALTTASRTQEVQAEVEEQDAEDVDVIDM